MAVETGATPNQIVLAWMVQGDPPIIPLVAASTPEQMKENLAALNLILSEDQIAQLSAAA
ncbi:MAG: aldo/keto reductase [Anaerolineales bacterium]|nr:aldo/keto reductase [Anaerolineales bacterium]